MENVLNISNFGDGNRIKQGDLSEIRYVLQDANHDDLNLTGKEAIVYLTNRQNEVVYQKTLTVVNHDAKPMVTLTIDEVIPAGTYTLEIVVDNKYIFPSDKKEKIEVVDSVLGKTFKKVNEKNLYGEIIDYGLSNGKFDVLKGEKGEPGSSITITNRFIDEDGNTFVSFSDGTNITVHKGQQGESLQIQSKSVNDDGDVELLFSDGTRVPIPKGVDGKSLTYDDLTDEQKADLASFVPKSEVSDEQVINIMKKDFIKTKGEIKVHKVALVNEEAYGVPVTWDIYYDTKVSGENYSLDFNILRGYIDEVLGDKGGYDGFAGVFFNPLKFVQYLIDKQQIELLPPKFSVAVTEDDQTLYAPSNIEAPLNYGAERKVSYVFNGHSIEEKSLTYNEEQEQ
ncbi:hypothetical protein [Staphylococcus xylosus]|uniref:hypothetical protein n=1 Tax=Staphylococcus xylosus TaxID=1288 RepID=UPI0015FB9F44|nr:hypothetical protein [Staphylococcus xylosus]